MFGPRDRRTVDKVAGSLIQVGRVASVDEARHTARVTFADVDGDTSYDFPVLVVRRGDYSLPDVGALAVCLVPPGAAGAGFVLGTIYSDEDAPPASTDERIVSHDSVVRLGSASATDPVALADEVDARLNALQDAFDAHIHTTTATVGATAAVGTISPPTVPVGDLASVAASKVFGE